MRLSRHPEYTQYLQDRETARRCRQAVMEWRADSKPILVDKYEYCWTYERALNFVRSLVRLFRAYNRVLWEEFPYCRACGGGCCVLDASHVGPFDGIALALLDLPLPSLPEEVAARERECIYLNGQGSVLPAGQRGALPVGRQCSLPVEWRTLKCWSFYCMGGRWDPGASLGEHHGALARALRGVVLERLPEELRSYEQVRGESLVAHLDDPTDFAHALDDALFEILVGPLHARYPLLDETQAEDAAERSDGSSIEEDVLAFVAQAMEQLFESGMPDLEGMPVSPDQLLADLELLEWIVAGRPSNQVQLLEDMHARYAAAPAPGKKQRLAVDVRMRACIARMLKDNDR